MGAHLIGVPDLDVKDQADVRVDGFDGCNHRDGMGTLDEGRIAVLDLDSSLVDCQPPRDP